METPFAFGAFMFKTGILFGPHGFPKCIFPPKLLSGIIIGAYKYAANTTVANIFFIYVQLVPYSDGYGEIVRFRFIPILNPPRFFVFPKNHPSKRRGITGGDGEIVHFRLANRG